ncbi:MAG: heavy metal sensor histidine kinase [Deltaproteobacteria bacterium]|nr:heavy metal sensor histidine kinase [Deltaproteobacteria bacterium]
MLLKKNLSLTARLTIAYTLSSVSVVLVATLYLYWSLVHALDYRNQNFFSSKIEAIRSLLARDDGGRALHFRIEKEWPAQAAEIFHIRLFDKNGRVLTESPGETHIFENLFSTDQIYPGKAKADNSKLVEIDGQVFRTIIFSWEQGKNHYTAQIALDRSEESLFLKECRHRLFIVLSVCLVVCTVVCFQIAQRGMRPVREMVQTASSITSSNLDEKMLPNEMPSELARLALTFNEMLDRLKASFDRLRRFSADIAHELRTPINNISGELQLALGKERSAEYYKEAIGSSLEECSRISRIIDSLLFLARADHHQIELQKEQISVWKELKTVLEFYEPAATEKGIACTLDANNDLVIAGERTLFQRAVGNIISNAINKTGSLGRIQISAVQEDNEVQIRVKDSGEGIAPEHLPHLFDRFYRVDASRTKGSGGCGLGLAIVKSIALIHGGNVHIESKVGVGTLVSLSFPGKSAPLLS